MTPVPNAQKNSTESRYNNKHIRAQNTVERCFGKLKQRFRCLLKHRVLHYNHQKAGFIVYTLVPALHNILIELNIEDDDDPDNYEEDEDQIEEQNEIDDKDLGRDVLATGRRQRNRLTILLENM